MELSQLTFKNEFKFLIIFAGIFAGDYLLYQYSAYIYIGILLLIYIIFFKPKLNYVRIFLTMFALSLIFFVIAFANNDEGVELIYPLLLVAFGVPLLEIFYSDYKQENTAYLAPILLFLFFSISIILSFEYRPYVFFGPNILYRVLTFLFLYIVLFNNFSNSKIILFLLIGLFIFSMILTRSRGAGVVLATVLIFCFYYLFLDNKYNVFNQLKIIIPTFFIVFIIFDIYGDTLAINRLFLFNDFFLEYRINNIYIFIDYLNYEGLKNIILGSGIINNYFNYYPHNLFIESLVYYGILLFMLPIFFLLSCINSKDDFLINIIFLISIFIGSLFSGDLMESFIIFSAGARYLVGFIIND